MPQGFNYLHSSLVLESKSEEEEKVEVEANVGRKTG